jgi:protein phosphatase 1L
LWLRIQFISKDIDFVVNSGDVPRVDGQLAVSRAFGDKSLKVHMTSEPHVTVKVIDDGGEFVILASDGLWKVYKI